MKCLVTGGAGFIGSHLAERLLANGHEVTVLDNFSSGNVRNLVTAQKYPKFTSHEVDIAHSKSIAAFFTGIDWVFHLAALADIVPSIERPTDYHRSNVNGTVAILEASRRSNVKRLIYAASASCYGIPMEYPTPETADIRPEYPYALTKYIAENYVLHWNQVYKLPCISLRLTNVYGPRVRTTGAYGAVFGVFLAQKLAGKPFTVVGDGSQTRDFSFITDVIEAFIAAAESNIEGEIFNVGSGHTYSVNRLVDLLGGEKIYIPKRPGEPDCTFTDISKIQRYLGWHPRVSFEEGVRIMLENIEDWRNAPIWNKETIAAATEQWFSYLGEPTACTTPQ